jgi:hypothetical protein
MDVDDFKNTIQREGFVIELNDVVNWFLELVFKALN